MNKVQIIKISQYGEAFASRIEGREAALSTLAYFIDEDKPKKVILDFNHVQVMTPSWLGEFVQTLLSHGIKKIEFLQPIKNLTVQASIEFVEEEIKHT
jgi:hypothetical protein